MMNAVVCGAVNVDYLAVPSGTFRYGDSNPGRLQMQVGGVGHNVAAALCALGCRVQLAAAIGQDGAQAAIFSDAAEIGLDLTLSRVLPGQRCGTYLCINDEKGNVAAAVSDMEICEQLTPAFYKPMLPDISLADVVLTEANLPMETLLWLGEAVHRPLCADCVSAEKAARLQPILSRLWLLKANAAEAERLTGTSDIPKAAQRLLAAGASQVLISLGAKGCYYLSRAESGFLPIVPGEVVNTNGCGDAFLAGAAKALFEGQTLREAAASALRVAAQNAAYAGTIAKGLSLI